MDSENGLSLIEVIFATGILMLLLIALVTAAALAVRNVRVAKNRSQAEKLAQEEMERIRVFRDRNSYDQLTCPSKCYIDASFNKQPQQEQVTLGGMDFTRYFEVDSPGSCPPAAAGVKEVMVTVEWYEGKGTGPGGAGIYRSKNLSCFTNWRAIP